VVVAVDNAIDGTGSRSPERVDGGGGSSITSHARAGEMPPGFTIALHLPIR
jgi:hypothetical protein